METLAPAILDLIGIYTRVMIFIQMDLIRKGMNLIFQLTVEHPIIEQRAVNTVLAYESVGGMNYMRPPFNRPSSYGKLMHLDLM